MTIMTHRLPGEIRPRLPTGSIASVPRPATRVPLQASTHPLSLINHVISEAFGEAAQHEPASATGRWPHPMSRSQTLRAVLLQALYSFQSDHQLLEQLQYNLLYRWFVGLDWTHPGWDPQAYARAREHLLASADDGHRRRLLEEIRNLATVWSTHFRIDESLFEDLIRRGRPRSSADELRPASEAPADILCAAGIVTNGRALCARLNKAVAVILQRIAEPDLDPRVLASELCTSRRALYLLFEEYGLTPTATIRAIRLECCRKTLSDPRQQSRKIIDVAMAYGFADAATFSRQFKRRFGVSPREIRVANQASAAVAA